MRQHPSIVVCWLSASVLARVACAQGGLGLVVDDLAPVTGGAGHQALAVGWECGRVCDCPDPYPCSGPCPESCSPPCARNFDGVFTSAELVRLGDSFGEAVLEPGFASPGGTATSRFVVGPADLRGRASAEFTISDPGGDQIRVEAMGSWFELEGAGYFDGEIRAIDFTDVAPFDGVFDGTLPGTVALFRIGCAVQGTMQYSYSRSASGCARGSLLVQAVGVSGECPADFNCSGAVDGDDVAEFFQRWDQGFADFNTDFVTDGDDVIAFFERWDAGC
ncbi:MAG: hypothetical protein ACOYN0_01980 [Phycisphaerales bacterium]